MKRLLLFLAITLCGPIAEATTTVTGQLQNLGTGTVGANAFVRFWLRGCGGNQPRVNGTAVIAPSQGGVFYFDFTANSSGNVSGTLYSTRDVTGLLGGDITCGTSTTSVWYGMQVFVGGKGGPEIPVHALNTGTLNISSVTPITVNPIIAAPTGDSTYFRKDAGNSPITGPTQINNSLTVSGTGTFANVNGLLNATQFAGADIFAKANTAFTSCSNICTVYIPAGTYNSVTTTLSLPVVGNGTAGLWIDSGAVINYTGTGDAILASGTGQPNVNLTIWGGGRVVGTSSATHGIHIIGFNKAQFYSLRFSGFSVGDGWFNEGVNTVDCFGCDLSNNLNGIHNVGKVVSGSNLSANAVHFFGGQVANNTGWGLLEDGTLAGTVGPNNNNTYHMVFESNGSNSNPSTSGNAFLQRCDICVISGSYFEELAGHTNTNQLLLGDSSSACGGANSCTNKSVVVRDNIFASGGTITNTINCVNCLRGTIDSNNEDGVVTNFFNNGSLSTNITYLTNIALSATNQQAGSGSYLFNLNNQNGNLSLVGNLIAVNHLFPSNNAQGLFQSSNDTIVRSATGGNVFLQDQLGNNFLHANVSNIFADHTIIPATAGSQAVGTNAAPFSNICLGTAATNNWCTSVAATAAARTLTWNDTNGVATVALPFFGSAGTAGYQTKRVSGCATAASLNATCDTTVTWTTAFADANYTAVCTGDVVTSGVPIVQGIDISAAKTGAAITVRTISITAAAAQFTTIDCKAQHD